MGGRMEAGKRQGQPRRLTDSFIIVSGSLGEDCLVGRSWWGGGKWSMRGALPSISSEDGFKRVGAPIFIENLLCARHRADVLHLTFPREPQPVHQGGIRDHPVNPPI